MMMKSRRLELFLTILATWFSVSSPLVLSTSADFEAGALYNLAVQLMEGGSKGHETTQKAMNMYHDAILLKPDFPHAHVNVGLLYLGESLLH
jgi:hypothetical protein